MGNVLLTNAAETDLRRIWIYSMEVWGEDQADRYLDEINNRILLCGEAYELGKQRSEIRAGLRSVPTGRHVIFYSRSGEDILVIRVLHDTMEPSLHFEEEI